MYLEEVGSVGGAVDRGRGRRVWALISTRPRHTREWGEHKCLSSDRDKYLCASPDGFYSCDVVIPCELLQ